MEITIFDVEHGACSLIKFPNGQTMLIDCGHNTSNDWRPSHWLKQQGIRISNLTISNMDEDHVSDLPNLFRIDRPESLTRNTSTDSAWVKDAKKECGMGKGVETACAMIDLYTLPITLDFGTVTVKQFCHSTRDFNDVNSLSIVTFVIEGNIGIIFPGDLTVEGWQKFLQNPEFFELLKKVKIFVASHHGRIDGYEPKVFEVCTPEVVIISDKGIMYDTQEVDYAPHALGIIWNGNETRKVLTTRRDGSLKIDVAPFSGFITAGINIEVAD